jgi:spore coat polysaccharide biosynthesis predicted glycosyltransferase SpsG/RimJ/RimL family protein N-acetyltransferase
MFSIDDIHAFSFYSKVIINHSGGITPMDYRSLPGTQFYLGPQYALLRKPFLQAAKNKRNVIADNNCFLCFGGADPQNHTMQVLQSQKPRNLFSHFHVVVGKAYRFKKELDLFAQEENITVHFAVSPQEIVAIMQQCSFAICSPSTIVYEYLSVGGIVFLEQIADNQKDVVRYFMAEGMAFSLDQLGQLSDEEITRSFERQSAYFDGGSDQRLKKIFRQFFESKNISIRPVNNQDLELCYQWANDEAVRAQSYNQLSIPLAAHTSWFNNKLKDVCSYFYILEYNEQPAGQIRFQVTGSEAIVGYLAGSSIRAKGFGATILAKGIEAFIRDYGKPVQIIGYVKKTNLASQRCFERLAFEKEETNTYPDSYKYTMNYGN